MSGFMGGVKAKPERIIGNVAVASLLGGVPAGAVLATMGVAVHATPPSALDGLQAVAQSALLGPVVSFVFGALYLAPALALLRRTGFAGPLVAVVLTAVPVAALAQDSPRAGLIGVGLAVPVLLVFCRLAYGNRAVER
ncbi:hypothetical protein [Lysobacter sp. A3-1-A15]|uniref:hypothetical protein n=1 Tax=Novilysobacter viscosus TaxID=3098602 RepID=UPI002EDB877E